MLFSFLAVVLPLLRSLPHIMQNMLYNRCLTKFFALTLIFASGLNKNWWSPGYFHTPNTWKCKAKVSFSASGPVAVGRSVTFLNVHSKEPNSLGPATSTCHSTGTQCPVTNPEEKGFRQWKMAIWTFLVTGCRIYTHLKSVSGIPFTFIYIPGREGKNIPIINTKQKNLSFVYYCVPRIAPGM